MCSIHLYQFVKPFQHVCQPFLQWKFCKITFLFDAQVQISFQISRPVKLSSLAVIIANMKQAFPELVLWKPFTCTQKSSSFCLLFFHFSPTSFFFFFFNCCAQGSAAFRVTAEHSVWHFKFDGILRESQATRTKCSLWTIATIQPPRFTQVWMNCECLLTSARWALSPSLKQDGHTIYSTSSYV